MGQTPGELNARREASIGRGLSAGASPGVDSGSSTDDSNPSTRELRAQIHQTQTELGATIDEIQERLSPQHLKQEATAAVRDATIGRAEEIVHTASDTARDAGTGIVDMIKQNPLPAALIGIGLGWMFLNGRGTSSSRTSDSYRVYPDEGTPFYRSGGPYGRSGSSYDRSEQTGMYYGRGRSYRSTGYMYGPTDATDEGQGGIGRTVDQARETVGDKVDQARETADRVRMQAQDRAEEVVDRAQETAEQVADQVQWQARRAQGEFDRMLNQNPLAVGALAIGVGAAIGMLVPETEKEHQVMGATRDRLMDQAKEVAQETAEKVQRVAEEAGKTVQQEAQEQKLTGR